MTERKEAGGALLVLALLAGVVAIGVWLRLEDPLSSPAIGAEDPYTHVVFVKEHIRRGYFDDVSALGTSLYPPGMHAFAGLFAPAVGVSHYDFARFSPAFFGALSIVGMALLAWRLGGPAAALATGLLVAVIPEHVARTSLFFPTMVDLALLPAFFYLFLLACDGRRVAIPLALAVTVALAYTHPWIVPLAAGISALYVFLRVLRGAPVLPRADGAPGDGAPTSFHAAVSRLALPAGLTAVLVAAGAVTRWDHGNTGFVEFLRDIGPLAALASLDMPVPALFVVLALVLASVAAVGVALGAAVAFGVARIPRAARVWGAWLLGGAAALLAWSMAQTPPVHVYYDAMLGAVPIALALLGVVLAFGRPTALGDLALALAGVMFPFTSIQVFETVFDSEYWPSRAVVYLALGVALLGGVAAAYAAEEAARLVSARRASRWAAPAATLVTVMLVAGAVAAAPERHEPWYRLYSDEHFELFEETAAMMEADPKMRVVVASWQPGLILKALADPYQVRYGPKYYNMTDGRTKIVDEVPDDRLYVLVDPFLIERMEQDPTVDLSFLDQGYTLVKRSSDDAWRLYRLEGGSA